MSLTKIAYQTANGIDRGLQQELKIRNKYHYRLEVSNSSRVIVIRLRYINPGYLAKIMGMSKQLNMWAGLSDKQHIRIGWQGHNILLEIPKPPRFWQQVTIENLEQYHYIRKGAIATIGLGLQRNPMRVDFRQDDKAHLFITGQTRSGKTNTQRLIGWNLAHNTTPNDAQMIIFDVAKRGYKWADFGNVASLAHPIVTQLDDADKVLAWASQELDKRGDQRRITPKIFLLIDELKALVDDSKLAADYLARISSAGGEFGLHLVLSTQYPQIQMLGSAELKRNVTTRLCGKVDDSTAAHNALGVAGSGAESLQGYGDFLLKDSDGLTRLTVAKIEARHVEKLPRCETVSRLELPDLDTVNNGPPPPMAMCVEPEHAGLALIQPMGIGKLRDEIVSRGLAETFSKDRAKRTKDFAEVQRKWIQANSPDRCAFDFLNGNWIEF